MPPLLISLCTRLYGYPSIPSLRLDKWVSILMCIFRKMNLSLNIIAEQNGIFIVVVPYICGFAHTDYKWLGRISGPFNVEIILPLKFVEHHLFLGDSKNSIPMGLDTLSNDCWCFL